MLKAKDEIIVDDEIVLKRFTHDVDQRKFNLIIENRDHLLPWLQWAKFYKDISDMERFTDSQIADFDAGHTLGYDIYHFGELVGSIDVHEISEANHYCYIGYWLDKKATGKGIMTRCAAKLTESCFKDLNMHRVSIDAAPENEASVAVAKRLNFKYEATLKEEQLLDNQWHDTVIYTKINPENML